MAFVSLSQGGGEDPENRPDFSAMMSMLGPGAVDQAVRQAIQYCWMMLPPDKKTTDEMEATIRRVVDRAIQDFREDSTTFRIP